MSPDPKPELKTLSWAIGQFASVERIVGEDKYFCETCHHYTEAERSLLFDKTPEVITIHLKRFSANSLESVRFKFSPNIEKLDVTFRSSCTENSCLLL